MNVEAIASALDAPIVDGDTFVQYAGVLLKEGDLDCPNPEDGFSLTDALIEPKELPYYISKHPDLYVWTLIDEDNVMALLSGVHIVNREGYLLTKMRAEDPRFDPCRAPDGSVSVTYFESVYDEEDNIVDL